jgi:POT family proton-dependent oligopeptide transporter
VCGYLGEKVGWHLGFGAAGIGMTLGLIQYVAGRDRLAHVGHPPQQPSSETKRKALLGAIMMLLVGGAVIFLYFGPAAVTENRKAILIGSLVVFVAWLFIGYLRSEEKKPVTVLIILFVFSVIFWAVFEQAGTSLTLFADRFVNRNAFGYEFPASWYQICNAGFLFILAPVFSILWIKLGQRQPSSPVKFSVGLFSVGLGAALMVLASMSLAEGGKVGPWWLIGVYLCNTVGELCLSPVGMSTTTKLAPSRLSGLMMGVWFLSISFGNFFAGEAAANFKNDSHALVGLFGKLALMPIIAAVILLALTPVIKKLMGKVR